MDTVSIVLALAFAALGVLHLSWVFGARIALRYMLPVDHGKPVFTPGRLVTLAVALVLLGFAGIALGLGVAADSGQPLKVAGFACGTILLVRAVGDFKYIGFFKRIKGSAFATCDDWLYSPFCLIAGALFWLLAQR